MIQNMHLFKNNERGGYELTIRADDGRLYAVLIPFPASEDLPSALQKAGIDILKMINARRKS